MSKRKDDSNGAGLKEKLGTPVMRKKNNRKVHQQATWYNGKVLGLFVIAIGVLLVWYSTPGDLVASVMKKLAVNQLCASMSSSNS